MFKVLLVVVILGISLCQEVEEILKNIQQTRLEMCGCDVATLEKQCFGPCKWDNSACVKDQKFQTKNIDGGQRAESSGDLKLTNQCGNYFDEEGCIGQRNHDGLFCTWEQSECVSTDCNKFGADECQFIYFCHTKNNICTRCAGSSYSYIISLGILLSTLILL